MKTASLVAALYLGLAILGPQAALAQDQVSPPPQTEQNTPSPAAPTAEPPTPAPAAPAPAAPAFVMPDLPVLGAPTPGGVNYQIPVTSVAEETHWLSWWVHLVMLLIVLLVTGLLLAVIFKFNAKKNPVPARFTHNTKLEIAWTLGPVLILILIGSFSLPILFKQLEIPEPDLTIKVTGNQWYWNYEYPDNEFNFDSIMLAPDELAANGYADQYYRLAADTALVVPVGAVVKVLTTGADVIHSFAVPAFGIKIDAVPGRLNETWFEVDRPGIYFGQCSELCGKDHAFMPITVKALEPADYAKWLDWAIDEYGGTRGENLASAN